MAVKERKQTAVKEVGAIPLNPLWEDLLRRSLLGEASAGAPGALGVLGFCPRRMPVSFVRLARGSPLRTLCRGPQAAPSWGSLTLL